MPKHFYLKIPIGLRFKYLNRLDNDDLIILQKDLIFYKKKCPILSLFLKEKGISISDYENHILPPEFLIFDRIERRLPKNTELKFKYFMFYAFKYNLIIIGCSFLIYKFTKLEPNVEFVLVIFLFLFLFIIPIIFSPFNLNYNPLIYSVVRPFNDSKIGKPLKSFLRKNIGLRCQGYTLSDKNFSPNFLFVIFHKLKFFLLPILLIFQIAGGIALVVLSISPWVMQSVRIKTILAPSGFINLPKDIRKMRLLNSRHFFTGGQCFNIKTIDESWKYTIQLLFYNSNFIIVDLSLVKPGSDWEINFLKENNLIHKCICICQDDKTGLLEKYNYLFNEIILYNDNGKVINNIEFISLIESKIHQEI